jgi:hypothetical protein
LYSVDNNYNLRQEFLNRCMASRGYSIQ